MYTVKYRNIDQAHTKFMTVILFREGERMEPRGGNGGLYVSFRSYISLKNTTIYEDEHSIHGFGMLS